MSDDANGFADKKRHLRTSAFTDYEVGFGKPPADYRFRKGQSGNPRGRPKGSKSKPRLNEARLHDIILKEAYRSIKLYENGKTITLPMTEAIVRSIAVNAAKGQARSQKMFTQMLSTVERERRNLHNEWLQTAIEYKVSWMERIEDAKRRGLPPPQPVPHPDHIEIDMNTGEVIIKGPFTPEEKAQWDQWAVRKQEAEETIEALTGLLSDEVDEKVREKIQDDINFQKRIISMITTICIK